MTKLLLRMTTSSAFTQSSSVVKAVSIVAAAVTCYVIFVVTDRAVSRSFAGPRERDGAERDDKERDDEEQRLLAFHLGNLSERTGDVTRSGAARRMSPAPPAGATFRRDLPDVGSDDRPPGVCTGRARGAADAPEVANGGDPEPLGPAASTTRDGDAPKAEDRRHATRALAAQSVRCPSGGDG